MGKREIAENASKKLAVINGIFEIAEDESVRISVLSFLPNFKEISG